jgi:DNA end-binding protein Ku
MIDAETSEVVEREERARGYEVERGEYLVLEDEELEALQIESTRTIEIEQFVPQAEVDPVYRSGSHYLTPDGRVAEEAFTVIREAMRRRQVVGLGRVVLARKERLVVLDPRGKGLLATTLHYRHEVRDSAAYFEDIPAVEVPDEMLDLALHIIDRKAGHFDPKQFEDRYENAVLELIRAKQAGRTIEPRRLEQPANVVNLMDALKRSIEAEGVAKRRPAARSKTRTAGQRKQPARTRRKG